MKEKQNTNRNYQNEISIVIDWNPLDKSRQSYIQTTLNSKVNQTHFSFFCFEIVFACASEFNTFLASPSLAFLVEAPTLAM